MTITITVRKSGPYFIHPDDLAQVRLVDHEGNEIAIPGKSLALCRCGASSTKPFCDRSHREIGFLSCETASGATDSGATAAPITSPILTDPAP